MLLSVMPGSTMTDTDAPPQKSDQPPHPDCTPYPNPWKHAGRRPIRPSRSCPSIPGRTDGPRDLSPSISMPSLHQSFPPLTSEQVVPIISHPEPSVDSGTRPAVSEVSIDPSSRSSPSGVWTAPSNHEASSGLVQHATQTPSLEYMPSSDLVPTKLHPTVESVLTEELWGMYENLRPSEQDLMKRRILVDRLQHIFDLEWPSYRFIVHPFGSAVNMLCSRHSDLDVCLTAADEYERHYPPSQSTVPRSFSPTDDRTIYHRPLEGYETARYNTPKSRSISATTNGDGYKHSKPYKYQNGPHRTFSNGSSSHYRKQAKVSMRSPSEMMFEIAAILRRHGFRDIDLRKARARVPVIRFVDPDLDLSCDININNPLALHNTLFVRHYVTRHPLVAPFMVLIKYWTQSRVLNDAAGGSLSSYCWTILMIYFLQRTGLVPTESLSGILPDLAAWEAGDATQMPPVPPHNCLVITGPPHILRGRLASSSSNPPSAVRNDGLARYPSASGEQETQRHASLHPAPSSMDPSQPAVMTLGGLYFAFFRFYCMEFNYDSSVVALRGLETVDWDAVQTMVRDHAEVTRVALKKGEMYKQLKLWAVTQLPPRDYRPLCVEDPLSPMRNLANNASLSTVMGIQKEMWRVVYILAMESVFLETVRVSSRLPHIAGSDCSTEGDGKSVGGLSGKVDQSVGQQVTYPPRPGYYLRRLCEKFQYLASAESSSVKTDRLSQQYPSVSKSSVTVPIGIPQGSHVPLMYSNMMPVASPIFSILPVSDSVGGHSHASKSSSSEDEDESFHTGAHDVLSDKLSSYTEMSSDSSSTITPSSVLNPSASAVVHVSAPGSAMYTLPTGEVWCYYMPPALAPLAPQYIPTPPPPISTSSNRGHPPSSYNDHPSRRQVPSHPTPLISDDVRVQTSRGPQPPFSGTSHRDRCNKALSTNELRGSEEFVSRSMGQQHPRLVPRAMSSRDRHQSTSTRPPVLSHEPTYNGFGNVPAMDSSPHALAHQIQPATRLMDVGLPSGQVSCGINAKSPAAAHDPSSEVCPPRAPAPQSRTTSPTSTESTQSTVPSTVSSTSNIEFSGVANKSLLVVPPPHNTKRRSWSAEAGDLIISSRANLRRAVGSRQKFSNQSQIQRIWKSMHVRNSEILRQQQHELTARMSRIQLLSSAKADRGMETLVPKNGVPPGTAAAKPLKRAGSVKSAWTTKSDGRLASIDKDGVATQPVIDVASSSTKSAGNGSVSWAQVVSTPSPPYVASVESLQSPDFKSSFSSHPWRARGD